MAELNIQGFPELDANLKSLAYSVQKKVLTKAAKAGAEPIRAEAEARAPVGETHNLAESQMISMAGTDSDINQVTVKIGPAIGAFYGLFEEIGTAHSAADPFLLPAYEDKQEEAIALAGDVLWAEIQKALKV
jgi:HK97 gp10 family phage protein